MLVFLFDTLLLEAWTDVIWDMVRKMQLFGYFQLAIELKPRTNFVTDLRGGARSYPCYFTFQAVPTSNLRLTHLTPREKCRNTFESAGADPERDA